MNPLDQYMKKLHVRHEHLKKSWDDYLFRLMGDDAAAREEGLGELLVSLDALESELTPETTPSWIELMRSNASALGVSQNYNNAKKRLSLFRTLSSAASKMQAHKFNASITDDISPLVNLDAVVSKHHDQKAINEIYDRAVAAITEALDSGQIDSSRIQQDLRRILATIETAQKSSFVNQLFQIPNLNRYLKALAKVSAKRVPVLNFVLDVVEEANKELDESNAKINAEIRVVLERQSTEIVQIIEHQPLGLIEHQQDNVTKSAEITPSEAGTDG